MKIERDSRDCPNRPLPETPLEKAAFASGGVLLKVTFRRLPQAQNGGCGAPTLVEGTNGGTVPCGALLTQFGKTEPYYCGACHEQRS
jgi:hypothetical protein